MEKANFTSVVDTPEIIHAQQVKNLSSQVRTFIRISHNDPNHKEQVFPLILKESLSNHNFASKKEGIHL